MTRGIDRYKFSTLGLKKPISYINGDPLLSLLEGHLATGDVKAVSLTSKFLAFNL